MAPMVPWGDWMGCTATKAESKVYMNRWSGPLAASFDIVLACLRRQDNGPFNKVHHCGDRKGVLSGR